MVYRDIFFLAFTDSNTYKYLYIIDRNIIILDCWFALYFFVFEFFLTW